MNSLDVGVWRCRNLVQKGGEPSFSLAGPAGLALFLRDMESVRRAKTEAEYFWYYVAAGGIEKVGQLTGASAVQKSSPVRHLAHPVRRYLGHVQES